MQKITGPGLVFLEIDGYCQEYDLKQGSALFAIRVYLRPWIATCEMDIQRVKGVKNVLFGGEGLFDTVVTGPGKVYLQTMTIPKTCPINYSLHPHFKLITNYTETHYRQCIAGLLLMPLISITNY